MKNYLAQGLPETATKAQARNYFANLPKADLEEVALELLADAKKTQGMTPALTAVGAVSGLGIGEAVNYLLRLWSRSDLPLAKSVSENLGLLRAAPHAVLAGILILYGYQFENKAQAVAVFGGVGLATSALLRFLDWFASEGDKTAAEERALQERLAYLERELATVRGESPAKS